jgi:hypothetical protein
MNIPTDLKLDFSDLAKVKRISTGLMQNFRDLKHTSQNINIQNHRYLSSKSEFLVPAYIMWRKTVAADSLLASADISDKRRAIVRKAISQSEKQGIKYSIVNPLPKGQFLEFLNYYNQFNDLMGYDLNLTVDYYSKHVPENLFLINIHGPGGQYFGGRLIGRYKNNLSTDYRAVERTKLVKEGFDTICEKIYYDIAVQCEVKYLGRGKELNLKGLENRSLGMLWNKLKWGYQPTVARIFPRIYVDFSFLNDRNFDLVFFVSLENDSPILSSADERLVFNFVCGDSPDRQQIESVKEKSPCPIRVWDRDFNLIKGFELERIS